MTHYGVLGVPPGFTANQIRDRYLELAKQHHPDKGGNLATFQNITDSYAVLKDPVRRRAYDVALVMLGHQCAICHGEGLVQRTISFGKIKKQICATCEGTGQEE